MEKAVNNFGNKCTCGLCKSNFYDLNKVPPTCPKCGEEYTAPLPKAAKKRYIRKVV